MLGRADIEGSKSYVALDAWQPQASYPCGNFSDTSRLKLYSIIENRNIIFFQHKGSIGHAFTFCIRTENHKSVELFPFWST
uniref:Senescence-associated protein n=1 Tax=Lotus japonicus TaxID=34305 RepID=I3SXT3_LOTJA|nr:unknown [Lotus japonicus]